MTWVEELAAAVGQPPLFPLEELPPVVPAEELSDTRRRTRRQRQLVDLGVHPLTRDRARPELGTCGGCAHRRAGEYPKCALGPVSRGPATDCRAWWPACSRWEPGA